MPEPDEVQQTEPTIHFGQMKLIGRSIAQMFDLVKRVGRMGQGQCLRAGGGNSLWLVIAKE